jgi:transcriptional regulator with XRE-family HTH domain
MTDRVPPTSLSALVAEEIRVALTRKRRTQRALAEDLGVSAMWVSDRLNCETEISLTDLERIAAALDMQIGDLIPAAALDSRTVAA